MAAKLRCHSGHEGGYDYEFIDTPSDMLVCEICQHTSREPHLSVCCGHTFCKSCLEAAKKASITDACPICQEKGFTAMPNKQADRAIRSLHVFCTNKDKGCEWQGEVNDIINHLGNSDGCQFEEVTCSNDCGKCLQRQYLAGHVQDECLRHKVDCQYCHITGEHQFIEGEHKEQCPKFPIACPNKCEVGSVPRDEIEEHMKMCPLELIQCEYHVVGCEERMARKDQKKHNKEKMEDHLSFITHKLTNTQHYTISCLKEQTTKITQTGNDLDTTKELLSSALKTIDQLITRQQQTEKDTASQLEKCKDELVIIEREQKESKDLLTVTREDLILKLQEMEEKVTNKFQTKIAEIETAAQKKITELETKLEQKTRQIEQLISDSKVCWYTSINYQASKLSSGNRVIPVIVKMSEYTKKKSGKVHWYSEPFFTHHQGYKMYLEINANGLGDKKDYMSVSLYLMKGPYDDQLKWPLKGHCEVKLLNQISNSEHHLGSGACNGQKINNLLYAAIIGTDIYRLIWCSACFISHDRLHKITPTCQYIKDDSVFFQVDYKLVD